KVPQRKVSEVEPITKQEPDRQVEHQQLFAWADGERRCRTISLAQFRREIDVELGPAVRGPDMQHATVRVHRENIAEAHGKLVAELARDPVGGRIDQRLELTFG